MAITTERSRRGGALLAVLWLSAALAAIAFSLASTVREETGRASTASDGLRAEYIAEGAVRRTALHLLWSLHNGAAPPASRPTRPDLDILQFPGGEAQVEIIPETARLNLNAARPEDLFHLLVNLAVDPAQADEIAAAIVDWRSPRPDGGPSIFDQYYLSRTPSFHASHASFEETEELLMVKGMTPEIYYGTYLRPPGSTDAAAPLVRQGGLRDCVSVYGTTDRFDVNTAPPAVLAAAGIPPDTINALIARRRAMPFQDINELATFLQGAPALGRLRVGGNVLYTLRATARPRLPDGQLSDLRRTVAALVKIAPLPGSDSPYHILRWYEAAGGQ